MRPKQYVSRGTSQTMRIGKEIAGLLVPRATVLLRGPLGAGKTTLAKGIIGSYGVDPDEVNSPSFVYVREYETKDHTIYHIDLYRIDQGEYILDLDYLDILKDPRGIVIIEWPERIREDYLPDAYYDVQLEIVDLETRNIIVTKKDT